MSRGSYVATLWVSLSVLTAIIRHVVLVLLALGDIACSQERYDESLQMYGRVRDIMMIASPNSKELATGIYDEMSGCRCVSVTVCSVSQYGCVLYGVIAI